MKKLFSKSIVAVIISTVIVQFPLLAQVKTTFTKEVRKSEEKPVALGKTERIEELNKVDVAVPKKTRGAIDRYKKLNIWGKEIPDSFLFYRNTLDKNQKAVYDAAYKALMKNETEVTMPVGLTKDDFYDTVDALVYDNPEGFWWTGSISFCKNSDGTVTSFDFINWVDGSELEQKYEEFWNATSPILFCASKLPDEMSKIKYIHDYICLSTEYDHESVDSGNDGGKLQTAYSCAVDYKAICAGYASLFAYYMQNLGIPCVRISSGSHAWNLLKVNGQYYQMDVTWNDTEVIPPYYNLTHEEMQNVISHTPIAISKKVIDANPSTGKEMSYLKYFGALVEGSPYAYKELMFFDPEKINNQNGAVKIYKNTPEFLSTVKNLDDFITLINQTDYYKGLDFSFFAPNPDVVDEIVHWLIYNSPFTWDNGHRDYVGDSVIYNFTFTSSKEKSESITDASTNKNSDSNTNNFTVPSRIENSQTSNSNNTVKKVAPKIGDKGPGGGIVFYIGGNKAYECSDFLGETDWEAAKKLCKDYRGGGKSDWYLPTRDQLFLIYWNLRKEGKIRGGAWYWTSSTDGDEFAWEQSLLEAGAQVRNYKDSTDAVLAIREFEY